MYKKIIKRTIKSYKQSIGSCMRKLQYPDIEDRKLKNIIKKCNKIENGCKDILDNSEILDMSDKENLANIFNNVSLLRRLVIQIKKNNRNKDK